MKPLKTLTTLTALTALIAGVNAYAQGNQTGGGGDRITCLENGRLKHYLLDVYEANRGRNVDLSELGPTMENRIEVMRQRLAVLDPARAEKYALEVMRMLADIRALEAGKPTPNGLVAHETPLKDIDDADERFDFLKADQAPTARKCSKAQLIRQEKPKFERIDATYFLDLGLWADLDDDNKVATLYHEVIYKEMRSNGAQVSKSARRLNALMLTNSISTLPSGDYYEFVKSENLKSFRMGGLFELTSELVDLSPGREITRIQSNYTYRFGSLDLQIANPRFRDHAFVDAEYVGTLGWTGDQVTAFNSKTGGRGLQGGTLEVAGDQRLVLRGAKKSDDGGEVTLTLDPTGKIVDRVETGYFTAAISSDEREALHGLFACVKQRLGRKALRRQPFTRPEAYFERARLAIGIGAVGDLQALLQQCQSGVELDAVQVSSEAKGLVESLTKPSLVSCRGFKVNARASAILGVGAGVGTLNCLFTNGTRRQYAGVLLGMNGGALGASVHVGTFVTDRNGDGRQWAGNAGALTFDEKDEYGTLGIYLPESWKKAPTGQQQQAYETDPTINEKQSVGVGFHYSAISIEAMPMLPLWKKKDDFSELTRALLSRIVVQK